MISIDLNADIGESFGNYTIGNDSKLLNYITSANIACGFHAGDPVVIRKTVLESLKKGVAIGAHPGYPDKQGFGRRSMKLSRTELYDFVLYQVGALNAIVKAEGGKMQHVKAHGALYNDASKNPESAMAITEAIYNIDPGLLIFCQPGSAFETAAKNRGIAFKAEGFADRAYDDDGSLVSRSHDGAMITSSSKCVERVLKMVLEKSITSINGKELVIKVDTICLHGDNEHALTFARLLKESLINNSIRIKAFR